MKNANSFPASSNGAQFAFFMNITSTKLAARIRNLELKLCLWVTMLASEWTS